MRSSISTGSLTFSAGKLNGLTVKASYVTTHLHDICPRRYDTRYQRSAGQSILSRTATRGGICIRRPCNHSDSRSHQFLPGSFSDRVHMGSAISYLDLLEEVFAASKTSHEQERINSLIDLLGLFFNQVEHLNRRKTSRDHENEGSNRT